MKDEAVNIRKFSLRQHTSANSKPAVYFLRSQFSFKNIRRTPFFPAAEVWRKFPNAYSADMFSSSDRKPNADPTAATGLAAVLTTSEAAQLLRCSKAHLCNLLNARVRGLPPLPYLRLGRRRLIRREVLLDWLKQVESQS